MAPEQVPFGGHIYVNVNEEDVPYDKHDNLPDALTVLQEFPNDTVVVCYADSPVGQAMVRELPAPAQSRVCEFCDKSLDQRTSVDDCPENFHNHNDVVLDAPGAAEQPAPTPDMP